jgi:GNAT superfamily N-acetyltransferase
MSPPTAVLPTLRRAGPADAGGLAEFAARTFRETYAPPHGDSAASDVDAYVAAHFTPADQAAELADPALCTLVADVGGAIVGYAQVRVGATPAGVDDFAPLPGEDGPPLLPLATAELARLYVDRAWHGAGLAAILFDAARHEAAAWGAGALWFSVYQGNARALAFYRKRGARPVAAATFRMGNDLQHDWLLAVATGPG